MMMIILAFRDLKADSFHPPMFTPHQNVALREIASVINAPLSQDSPPWARYPDDFELWRLGTWESESGQFIHDERPKQILLASALKQTN